MGPGAGVRVHGRGPAVLASWAVRGRPHQAALSVDTRILGAGGPPMTTSWVVHPPDRRPLFDAPEVLEARRVLLRDWPAYGASCLVGDSVPLAGAVTLHRPGAVGADPFARAAPAVLLDTTGVFVPLPAPTGPTLERYSGAPWPYDRFAP